MVARILSASFASIPTRKLSIEIRQISIFNSQGYPAARRGAAACW